ncbi:MAG: hypothetical protein EKK47_10395 [Burkholderiales bacterium]|nr:MAG: hypothetical protein EKK47_10395 [Burkholderiales bacterium]
MHPNQIRTSSDKHFYDYKFRRSFDCAGRTVYVAVTGLDDETGAPVFRVHWMPDRPTRLTADDIAAFDAGRRQAIAALTAELEAAP